MGTHQMPVKCDCQPYWQLWARSTGHDCCERVESGKGHEYIAWINAQWREWAESLGFGGGMWAACHARASGHSAAEFVAWLRERVT